MDWQCNIHFTHPVTRALFPPQAYCFLPTKKKKKKKRRQSVGQTNLSRENRSVSKSVNCAELERKKFYFFRMKAKQDPSLFTLSHPFLKKILLNSLPCHPNPT
ncbi:unnamed protein product [Eretmochelys imbricata]